MKDRRDSVSLSCIIMAMIALAVVAVTYDHSQFQALAIDRLTTSFVAFVSLQSIAGVAAILGLERLVPARPDQRVLGPSLVLDALYLLVQLPLISAILVFMSLPVSHLLQRDASWLVVDSTRSWPMPIVLVTGLIVSDLALWATHVLKHRVPLFWRFHMIHHSQANLNLFSANRAHPFDAMIEHFVSLVPMFILFPGVVSEARHLFLFGLVFTWHIRFQHANIRTGLGPLRWILVSPQSHRIHHSNDPAHYNTNFANVFCWDRLFGLQHPDVTSYPATGLDDPAFPEPSSFDPARILTCYARQLVYPLDPAAYRLVAAPGADAGLTAPGRTAS